MPPLGFQRSRALWENAVRPHPVGRKDRSSGIVWWLEQQRYNMQQLLRAILYELQPIRYSVFISNSSRWYRCYRQAGSNCIVLCREWIPYIIQKSTVTVSSLTWDQWKWIGFGTLYYLFLRWVHSALDAGPLVLIVTVLVIIFTVGLSDERDPHGLSAYSVFNKGFQKILGSVDADALLQQHLGGGFMQMIHHAPPREEIDAHDEPPIRLQQQRRNPPDNNNVNEPEPPPIEAPRARRTGKKARRDRATVERRREIRAQREAALAMGLNDDEVVARLVDRDVFADVQ